MRSRQPRLPLSAALPAGLIITLLAAAPLTAQTVEGTVVEEESGTPIPGVEVLLLDEARERETRAQTVTDSLGAFRLVLPAPGRYTLLLRRIGYATRTTEAIEVARAEVVVTEVALGTEALQLEPLVVVERRRERDPRLAQFYERAELNRKAGRGRIYFREDLRRVGTVRSLYQLQPERGSCPMKVLVDNLLVENVQELDFLADLERVEGVEIYRGQLQIPPEFSRYSACALMLVWTRPPPGHPFSLKRLLIGAGLATVLLFVIR